MSLPRKGLGTNLQAAYTPKYMNMTTTNRFFGLLSLSFIFFSCTQTSPPTSKDLASENLIPKPVSLEATGSSFAITAKTRILVDLNDSELTRMGIMLVDLLSPATGYSLEIQEASASNRAGAIFLSSGAQDEELGSEGYELSISEGGVSLKANEVAGIFYGIQTLRQLLPAKIELDSPQSGPWEIASGTIRDYPRFAYRGAMLDVARHFFEVDEVKQFMDYIAMYKINGLHLHLSDDQGWRIEIKSWPKLTEVGGQKEVGGGNGGFFTQEQYKDIVQYAADRFITVIPEIDMPGHTHAALVSYPELNCKVEQKELYTGIEVGFSTLCTDKEITYQFVNDVVKELAEITQGPYIHIGGDESLVTELEDYIPFIEKTEEIVIKHGKKAMGWDEIVHADLDETTVPQYWSSAENAASALEQNLKVLISPAQRVYLDMQYDSTTKYGLHWAAYIEAEDSYSWDPEELVEGLTAEHIMGVETPLWSETVSNIDEAEYMIFPRMPGIAEIAWSPKSGRNWEEYKVRLGKQKARFDALEINYYPSEQVPWE